MNIKKLSNATRDVRFSITKGQYYIFDAGSDTIKFSCVPLSGKETVTFNGKAVSKKYSYRYKSNHKFIVSDDRYQIKYRLQSFSSGFLRCSLYKNGNLIQAYRGRPNKNIWGMNTKSNDESNQRLNLNIIIPCLFIGICLTAAFIKPDVALLAISLAFFNLSFISFINFYDSGKPMYTFSREEW